MTIPKASNFPSSLDEDNNLFLVHDSLRVRLSEDYTPGDTSVLVEGDYEVIDKFPPTGIITLTEQCSDIDRRALSFYYSSRTLESFDGLELLPEFKNLQISKPKRITNVTMNVLDMHHNHLKDSLIAAENFIGTQNTNDKDTITGRINHIESVMFKPKAWFSIDAQIGLAPSTVSFINESFRLGTGAVTQVWDFGEENIDPIVVATSNEDEYKNIKKTISGVLINGTKLTKTYSSPGIYTVKLTVSNDYGSNTIEFKDAINVMNECPEPAKITIVPRASQNYTDENEEENTPPKIRSVANMFIDIEVPSGENPDNPGYSYGGELLNTGGANAGSSSSSRKTSPVDPIEEYTWSLSDDLTHVNSNLTRASYSLGGYYDIVLRVDTKYGAYRITKYENSIDVVESSNLWLFNYKNRNTNSSGVVQAYEFGLSSETFKTLGTTTFSVNRSNQFLSSSPLSYGSSEFDSGTLQRSKREFENNVEFVTAGTTSSGNKGNSLLFWASGGSTVDEKKISSIRYNAFDDHYDSPNQISNRPWNWVALNSSDKTYFLFGEGTRAANRNSAFAERLDYDRTTQGVGVSKTLTASDFENGADELLEHPSYFDDEGLATNGYFATYRSAWKDNSGYILRNSSVNEFFRISDFYKTKGSLSNVFSTITKLPDIVGSIKLEGQLATMYNGVFFFNNSGEISAWNDTSMTWEVGRANSASISFRSIQDTNKSNFDDKSNTLLVASDSDRVAYLSYDYSERAFVRFNGTDLTFSSVGSRPAGVQFKMGIY
jgi:PKD repeat protein